MPQVVDKIPLTREGLNELKKELQELEENKRPKVVARLSQARNEGDLSENSNYIQSREELSFIDGRIEELKEVINRSVVVGKKRRCSRVALGCQVTVKAQSKEQVFHLVGEWESDPISAKISHQSPLGKALLGKRVGEKVEVEAPAGKIVYKVVRIE